jgi:hypothetical protein
MLFHGTLYYPFQLLDELPMILLANEYISLLLSLKISYESINTEQFSRLHSALKYSYRLLPIVIVSYFIHPSLQIITFHLTLKISEITFLFLLYRLSKNLNHIVYSKIYVTQDMLKRQRIMEKSKRMISSTMGINLYNRFKKNNELSDSVLMHIVQTKIKKYLDLRKRLNFVTNVGIYMYGLSLVMWCLENMFCKYVEPLQLHAIWHVLSSISIYHINLLLQSYVSIENFLYYDI